MFSVIAVTFNLKYLLFRISFTREYLLSGIFFVKKKKKKAVLTLFTCSNSTNLIFTCSNSTASVLW